MAIPAAAKRLLDFIASKEAPKGYDTVYANKMAQMPKPLSSMTIDEPGQPLQISRTIKYLDDCELHYEYRAQSKVGKRRAVLFPDVDYEHPPMDLDGLPKTNEYPIPKDMECGPAYLVETASVGCTWFQRKVRRLRKPDVLTEFKVVGCAAPR